MKRINSHLRELFLEMLVGAFMFVVLMSLAFFTILLSRENYFAKTYPLNIVFEDVMGLRDGDNVVIRGMTVGKVKSLRLEEDGVHVTANLSRPLRLRTDYNIRVVPTSMLGGRYLQIDEGTSAADFLVEDLKLRGENPRDLMGLAAEVADDLKHMTAKIRAGEGTLGKLVNDDGLYDDAREIMGEIKLAFGDQGVLRKLDVSAANLQEITAKINEGEGTLGKLVNEDGLYEETTAMVTTARQTLDDIRETSPLVTLTTILFGAL